MRHLRNILVLGCAAVSLAACGGDTAPQTVGSLPAPGAGGANGGAGGGVTGGGGSPTPTPAPANFLDVATTTTFDAVGSLQAFNEQTTNGTVATLYTGNASTVNAPSGTVTYNPRDGVFTLRLSDSTANVTQDLTFQDPAHRTAYNAAGFAARQIPNLADFNYLEVFDGTANPVFFYQRPGTQTTFVSLGGFARTQTDLAAGSSNSQRGVFVFGQKTPTGQVPASGSGTFTGGLLASMIADPTGGGASYLQWINGSSTATVNFATGRVDLSLMGTVGDGFAQGGGTVLASQLAIGPGWTFRAVGAAQIDLVRTGGFTGEFTQNRAGERNVGFVTANGTFIGMDFASVSAGGSTAGASSIDGAFFGPNGINLGGNFRIIGGIPNERVDIMGAFTGAKQ